MPALAGALDLSVREAINAKVMLIPATVEEQGVRALSWVTASMVDPKRRGESAQIVTARDEQAQPDPRQVALISARRHAGAGRNDLRTALNSRIGTRPAPFERCLDGHPQGLSAATSPRPAPVSQHGRTVQGREMLESRAQLLVSLEEVIRLQDRRRSAEGGAPELHQLAGSARPGTGLINSRPRQGQPPRPGHARPSIDGTWGRFDGCLGRWCEGGEQARGNMKEL